MSIPLPFITQYECRNETLEVYASDRRGLVNYRFNNYGYRNDIDYETDATDVGVYIGSSITSGIGIDWSDSFVATSARSLGVPAYHFSQGCMAVDNQEILSMLTRLKQTAIRPRYWVIQFIDLNRRYSDGKLNQLVENQQENLDLFLHTFHDVQTVLENDVWVFTGSDSTACAIPEQISKHPRCLGWNIPFVDLSGVGSHPGVRWHKMISAGIVKKLSDQLKQS